MLDKQEFTSWVLHHAEFCSGDVNLCPKKSSRELLSVDIISGSGTVLGTWNASLVFNLCGCLSWFSPSGICQQASLGLLRTESLADPQHSQLPFYPLKPGSVPDLWPVTSLCHQQSAHAVLLHQSVISQKPLATLCLDLAVPSTGALYLLWGIRLKGTLSWFMGQLHVTDIFWTKVIPVFHLKIQKLEVKKPLQR
jgi:hypothetical protein